MVSEADLAIATAESGPVAGLGEPRTLKESALVTGDTPDTALPTTEIVPSELSVPKGLPSMKDSVRSGSPSPVVESTPAVELSLQTIQPSDQLSPVSPVQSTAPGETDVPPSAKLKSAVRKKPPEALIAMLTSTKAKQKVASPPVIPAVPVLKDPKALEASIGSKPSAFPISTN